MGQDGARQVDIRGKGHRLMVRCEHCDDILMHKFHNWLNSLTKYNIKGRDYIDYQMVDAFVEKYYEEGIY